MEFEMLHKSVLIFILSLLFSSSSIALHQPYVDETYQSVVTSGELIAGSSVDIYISGQTSNSLDGDTGEYLDDWTINIDTATMTFLDGFLAGSSYNLFTLPSLDFQITSWRYWFDESEGLTSAAPDNLRISGTLTDLDGALPPLPFVISTVPVPAAAWLFGSALIGLAGIKRKK
jgi:hypothetical protein